MAAIWHRTDQGEMATAEISAFTFDFQYSSVLGMLVWTNRESLNKFAAVLVDY